MTFASIEPTTLDIKYKVQAIKINYFVKLFCHHTYYSYIYFHTWELRSVGRLSCITCNTHTPNVDYALHVEHLFKGREMMHIGINQSIKQ